MYSQGKWHHSAGFGSCAHRANGIAALGMLENETDVSPFHNVFLTRIFFNKNGQCQRMRRMSAQHFRMRFGSVHLLQVPLQKVSQACVQFDVRACDECSCDAFFRDSDICIFSDMQVCCRDPFKGPSGMHECLQGSTGVHECLRQQQ